MKLRFTPVLEKQENGGWSDWICPKPSGYLMKCCDCGLVHELDFKAFVEANLNKRKKTFEIVELPLPIRAMFRARRWRKE